MKTKTFKKAGFTESRGNTRCGIRGLVKAQEESAAESVSGQAGHW
jgi:hypothetical protein